MPWISFTNFHWMQKWPKRLSVFILLGQTFVICWFFFLLTNVYITKISNICLFDVQKKPKKIIETRAPAHRPISFSVTNNVRFWRENMKPFAYKRIESDEHWSLSLATKNKVKCDLCLGVTFTWNRQGATIIEQHWIGLAVRTSS